MVAALAELFHQTYSPVAGSILLSALVASIPPLLLALMLAVLALRAVEVGDCRRHQRVRCSRGWCGACRSA